MIEVNSLVKDYRVGFLRHHYRALAGVNFNVEEGEIVALLGPNGAGKSTILRLIFDFIYPTAGEIKVFGQHTSSPDWRRRAGYMPEYFVPTRFLKGRKFLELVGKLYEMSDDDIKRRTQLLSDVLDMDDLLDRKLGAYSRGMTQKIGLAQAMLAEPKLLVLDEPTANLDASIRKKYKDFLEEEVSRGKTVLISSHVLSEIEELATRVIFLKDGTVHAQGAIDDLLHPTQIYEIHFKCDAKKLVLDGLPDTDITPLGPESEGLYTLSAKGDEARDLAVKSIVSSGGSIVHLALKTQKLENVFVQMMERRQ